MTAVADGGGPSDEWDATNQDKWLASLATLFVIPEEYRDERFDRAAAAELLGCGEKLLDTLIANGLPHGGETGDERFDRFDLVNLALYSGVGTSVPEKATRYALRWMHESPESLYTAKRWDFSIKLSCAAQAGCGDDPQWTIARPVPELQGGSVESLTLNGRNARSEHLDLVSEGPEGLAFEAVLISDGTRQEIVSPVLREILTQFATDYRWVRMPEPLQWRTDLVLPQKAAPCIASCLELVEQCRAAGFEARTRRGWILGMLDLAHSWLEVVDSDGVLKMVDPAFMILAADHAERPHPDFRGACLGSRLNRLLPTEHHADQPVLGHTCGGTWSAPNQKTMIQLAQRPA